MAIGLDQAPYQLRPRDMTMYEDTKCNEVFVNMIEAVDQSS